jgi:hypothetical protein
MTTPELIAAIKLTNNGYIFAPTKEELGAAGRDLKTFRLQHNSLGNLTIFIR